MASTRTGQRHLLTTRFTPGRVREALVPPGTWRPYPTVDDRDAWAALPGEERARLVAAAEARLGMAWPALPATLFLEYVRDGNRVNYEEPHFARRTALIELILGECVEGRGRFTDDIINGIWALCEESFWGVPAHSGTPRFGDRIWPTNYGSAGLPDTAYPMIDLFAAETGALLAWAHYLLGARLAADLPVVTDRIEREVRDRILEPFRRIDSWWWLGLVPERPVNNWNPWIISNLLAMTLLLDRDAAVRAATVSRAIAGLDRFLDTYDDDGGCDEGTSYWGRAGASLFECLETLALAGDGALDGFDLPLVREMGRYLHRMHIGDDWYVNFADGAARISPESHIIYRYGQRIGDQQMVAQGAASLRASGRATMRISSIGRILPALFRCAGIAAADPAPPLIRDAWLDGIEVLVARERAGTTDGLFLAAKGGHNAESHNHNDIGSFIVALDGRPVVIDAGVGVYTRQTFGPERYAIWTMQSAYHNLPLIDGHQQVHGPAFRARDVRAETSELAAQLALDIAPAYPAEVGVRSWRRTIRLERGARPRIVLRDDYDLAATPGQLALHLLLDRPVDPGTPGFLRTGGQGRSLAIGYDPDLFAARVEPIAIADARLLSVWGARVYRVILAARRPAARGVWTVTFGVG